MSPRSSNVGELELDRVVVGVAGQLLAGYLNPLIVGGVVSGVVGSRCVMARLTTSLRCAWLSCSRPKPNVTESRVERTAPPVVG